MSNNYVYYTALINNDGSTVPAYESEVEPPFEFKEDRKVALLPNPEEYEVAVQSCLIDLKTLPVFITIFSSCFIDSCNITLLLLIS